MKQESSASKIARYTVRLSGRKKLSKADYVKDLGIVSKSFCNSKQLTSNQVSLNYIVRADFVKKYAENSNRNYG